MSKYYRAFNHSAWNRTAGRLTGHPAHVEAEPLPVPIENRCLQSARRKFGQIPFSHPDAMFGHDLHDIPGQQVPSLPLGGGALDRGYHLAPPLDLLRRHDREHARDWDDARLRAA